MNRHSFFYNSLIVAAAFLGLLSCTPKEDPDPQPEPGPEPVVVVKPSKEIQQADQFAIDLFSTYYLWSQEVKKDLPRLDPDTCKTPIPVVKQIRYHKGNDEVDHWTMLTNDLGSMTSSVQGLGLSYGYGFDLLWADQAHTRIVFIVQYVNKGKPADKAGLKRGDVIWTINGKNITYSNYIDMYNEALDSQSISLGVGFDSSKLTSVSMTANKEWEDPIIVSKTFDIDGKKVGYLCYNAFDLESSRTLPGVFRQFKEEGISELILDLRYNGGGYAFTECELASMIAPPANVAAGDVFQTEVYNAMLTEAWKDDDFNTYFRTKFETKSGETVINEDVSDANPGINKLYAIVTGGSASASEGLIVGLGPYMDITLIGEQTYGKYCAGFMLSPEDLYGKNSSYDYTEITKWGMYVMVSMFADKNGKNAAQPDGIPVNIKEEDDVQDGCQLGDENETMLKAALTAAGKTYPKTRSIVEKDCLNFDCLPSSMVKPSKPKGFLIKTDIPALNPNL